MSAEPKSADSLSQLKELMLGDELRHLSDLHDRLDHLDEDSVDRLARDLAAALHRRREMGDQSFDELVTALKSGTESAIQRSVSEDKSKLSKALFPIMGPAIRNYVVDLFRGMVEELNETIRNTTSAERIKWRAQAKLAGKSYSEFVLLKTRSFYIEEVYLMQRDTGLLLLHASRNPEDEADGEADLVSGMFTAIRSFVRDSFVRDEPAGDDTSELDSFTFGEREVLVEVGPSMILAAVAFGVPPPSAKDELKSILENLHAELGDRLVHFSGDMAQLESGRPTLRRSLMESRSTDDSEGDGGGGLWRAWAALGGLAAILAVISFFGMREQKKWNGFEEALRATPGVAVTEVENNGWWRHRRVMGLRDPLTDDPSVLAAKHGIASEKASFDFDLMESLDPVFASRREARMEEGQRRILKSLADLRVALENSASAEDLEVLKRSVGEGIAALNSDAKEAERRLADSVRAGDRLALETLVRSQFAGIEGLSIEFDRDTGEARFSGDLAAGDYEAVKERAAPLASVMGVNTKELSDASSARLAKVLTEIASIQILYDNGSLSLDSEDRQRVEALENLTGELDTLAETLNRSYRYEVLAHPLIGANRSANRRIEAQRSEQVRDQLVASGVSADRIEAKLSEDLERAGEGVSLVAKETGGELPEQ